MPRNACMECRTHKVKCITPDIGGICERCAARGASCSNVHVSSPRRPHTIAKRPLENVTEDGSGRVGVPPVYSSESNSRRPPQYDIGDGTPAEILREYELSKEILKLYFENFSDVHFMFHQDTFLQEFARGGIPKIILYAMLALGIRYSPLTIFGHRQKSHRGEPLFYASRNLLKEEFDQMSITLIQAYVLLSTYHFTFGGARKGLHYLGTACTMAKLLRLRDDHANSTPFRREMIRRLLSTLLIMDRTLSPSLNVPCNFSLQETINDPLPDNHLQSFATGITIQGYNGNLILEILNLSKLFQHVCVYHRERGTDDDWRALHTQQEEWRRRLPEELVWTHTNFSFHQRNQSVRKYLYIHLLYNHICQLIYFPFLQSSAMTGATPLPGSEQIYKCHHHAKLITDITDYAWKNAKVDMHNVSMGQVLTVAAAVIMHARLTSTNSHEIDMFQTRLEVIEEAFSRNRETCRIFDRMSAQLDTFLQICNQNSTSNQLFDKNQRLIQHILHYGTSYERAAPNKVGSMSNLQESSSAEDTDLERPSPDTMTQYSVPTPTQHRHGSSLSHGNLGSRKGYGHQMGQQSTAEPLVTSLTGPVAAAGGFDGSGFQNSAWMFSDSSLNNLYTIPFMDPTLGANDFYLGAGSG